MSARLRLRPGLLAACEDVDEVEVEVEDDEVAEAFRRACSIC
jgi:hypothetical protein